MILLLKWMQEIMKTMTQIVKKREDMFKSHYFKTFPYNPNDPNVDLFKFVGEINLCESKLRGKKR